MKEISDEKMIKNRELKRQEKERRRVAKKRISELIKKGASLVSPEKAKGWKRYVKKLLKETKDIDPVESIDLAINIMEMLENEATIDDAKERYLFSDLDENTMESARDMVFSFSKQGPEFYDATAIPELETEEKKENYDSRKTDFQEKLASLIPEYIKRGSKFIYPERAAGWRVHVDNLRENPKMISIIEKELEIMERLENGEITAEEVKKDLRDQGFPTFSRVDIMKNVLVFSKQGPDFYEEMLNGELSEEQINQINKIRKENAEFEEARIRKEEEQDVLRGVEEKYEIQTQIATIDVQIEELNQRRRELEAAQQHIDTKNGLDEKIGKEV